MTKLYVNAINDPSCIPNVQTAWETFVRTKCGEAKKTALLAYDKIMKAKLSKLPCDGYEILASHKSATGESKTIFREGTLGISTENTRRDLEELMVRRTAQCFNCLAYDSMLTNFKYCDWQLPS